MWNSKIIFIAVVVALMQVDISEGNCTGLLGQVSNPFYTRNSSIFLTWSSPVGWENCTDLQYEIQWKDMETNSIFFSDTTNETKYTFHFAAANFLCQIFNVSLTAKTSNISGVPYDTVIVGDNFTSISIDPVQNLDIQLLGNYMLVRWDLPLNFKACTAVYYNVRVLYNNTVVQSWAGNRQFFSFDYSVSNLCDALLLVEVTARYRDLGVSPLTRLFVTGPC